MTNVIQVPGTGQELAQSLAPLIQVLQQRHAQEEQQRQHELTLATQIYSEGLKTPGFESTPAAQELEMKLGVPGLGKSIAGARTAEYKRKLADIDTYVDSLSSSPATPGNPFTGKPGTPAGGVTDNIKAGLRLYLSAKLQGASAEVGNSLYKSVVGSDDMSPLDWANLHHLDAETAKLIDDVKRRGSPPTLADQQQAARILHQAPEEFVPTVNYVSVLEEALKRPDRDPRERILSAAMQFMAMPGNQTLLHGEKITPAAAYRTALSLYKSSFPEASKNLEMTPELTKQLEAESYAATIWDQIIAGNKRELQIEGEKVPRKFPKDEDIRRFLAKGLKAKYASLSEADIIMMLDAIENQRSKY